jgi:type IV secretory pathway VirB2 component (pilin)
MQSMQLKISPWRGKVKCLGEFLMAAVSAILIQALFFATGALAAIGGNTKVFDDLSTVISSFNTSAIAVVRGIGIAAIIVVAVVMMFGARPQFRLIAGAVIGLLMAALATPIVGFLFSSS